jgi:fanconi-associated nuclease 1
VEDFTIKDSVARIIQAHPLTRGSASGPSFGKSLFIGFESDAKVSMEELALQFYRLKEKFAQGSHCEGGPLGILFGLLMWDIMFDASIPHVFQTPVQDAPLDFGTEDFYNARKEAIEERFSLLESHQKNPDVGEPSILSDMIEQSFRKWHGRVCRVVNWARWTVDELKDIANCIGGKGLAVIFRRFALDFRYSHSGLPDLLLWDPPSRTFTLSKFSTQSIRRLNVILVTERAKFVEVKGPRDRLSDKQKIWIDYLMTAGIDIEVLYVREKLRDGEVDDSQDLIVEREKEASQLSPADPNAAAAPPIDNDAMVLD